MEKSGVLVVKTPKDGILGAEIQNRDPIDGCQAPFTNCILKNNKI